MFCIKCGAENPADASFCFDCGSPLFKAASKGITEPSVGGLTTTPRVLSSPQSSPSTSDISLSTGPSRTYMPTSSPLPPTPPVKCPKCGLTSPGTAQRCDCGYDFIDKTVKEPYFKEVIDPSLQGVGGWLLLFWFGMTVVSPLILIGQILTGAAAGPLIAAFNLALSGFCIYAGVALLRLQRKTLTLIKFYLILSFMLGCVIFISYVIVASTQIHPQADVPSLWAVAGPIIWWFYFKRSKRVRLTLGRNL
jgi:ribosomal protein L40E